MIVSLSIIKSCLLQKGMIIMNKEFSISVDASLCSRCGSCQKDCLLGLPKINESCAEVINSQACIKCGHCVAICPEGAISISGFEEAPEVILDDMTLDPEIFLAMMKSRRSIRCFKQQDVPLEIIEKIIEAGRYTPTGMNKQGVSYVVLRENKDEYERIAVSLWRRLRPIIGIFMKQFRYIKINDSFCFKGAPVAIVIKSNNTFVGAVDIVDGALAASAMELMARSYGLGVLYSSAFTNAIKFSGKLRRKLSINSRREVIITLMIGYPAVKYYRTAQREYPAIKYV